MNEVRSASPRYWLNRALFDLGDAQARAAFKADKEAYLTQYPLDQAAREALIGPGWRALVDLGGLPNLIFKYYMFHGHAPETFPDALESN